MINDFRIKTISFQAFCFIRKKKTMEAKYIFINLCVIVIVGIALASEEMFQAQMKCITENNLTRKEYDEAFHRPLKTTNGKIKCFFACLLENLEWMTKDGTIRARPGLNISEEEILEAQPCLKVNGTDKCDKGYNFFKCDLDERTKHGH